MFHDLNAVKSYHRRYTRNEQEGSRTMHRSFWKVIPIVLLLLATPGFAGVHPGTGSANKHVHASVRHVSETHRPERHRRVRHRRIWHLGIHRRIQPVAMPSERATQIQMALIKQGYLTGEPTGRWDAQTAAAMKKLQGDNGWQTKITPDSRALIKLGLGPRDDTTPPTTAPAPSAAADAGAAANYSPAASTSLAQAQPQ